MDSENIEKILHRFTEDIDTKMTDLLSGVMCLFQLSWGRIGDSFDDDG